MSEINRRIVVFCAGYDHPSTVEHVEAIADAFPHWTLTVVQEKPPIRWKPYLRSKFRRWKKEPVSFPLQALGSVMTRLRPTPRRRVDGSVRLPGSPAEIVRQNVSYLV